MEYEQIKRLMDDMGNSKLTSLDIEFIDGIKISMKKDNGVATKVIEPVKTVVETNNTATLDQISNQSINQITTQNINQVAESKTNIEEYKVIKSPMVGTFYSKPSPTAKPYVEVGSQVKKGDILCIVEAMKLMNEIESEFDGKLVEICVKNGEPVDFGKPLFKII